MNSNSINKEIGQWLKTHREMHNISQREMARRLGITNPSLHYMETGETIIRASTMIEYCLAMGEAPAQCVKDVMEREQCDDH